MGLGVSTATCGGGSGTRGVALVTTESRQATERMFASPFATGAGPHAHAYAHAYSRNQTLIYMALCSPRKFQVFSREVRAANRTCLPGKVLLAPLACLSSDAWAAASPAQTSYVHLVNMWRCFGKGSCFSKVSRLHWLRVNGFWNRA